MQSRPIAIQPADEASRGSFPPTPISSIAGKALTARARTSHACDRCKELRTKCSGEARCLRCVNDGASCQYSENKRQRKKNQLARTLQINAELTAERDLMLEALTSLMDDDAFREKHQGIVEIFQKISNPHRGKQHQADQSQAESENLSLMTRSINYEHRQSQASEADQQEIVTLHGDESAETGSTAEGPFQELSSVVDLGDGAGFGGHAGAMSAVSWLHHACDHFDSSKAALHPDAGGSKLTTHAIEAADLTYYTDDENLLAVDEDDIAPLQLPLWSEAVVLTAAYFRSLQGSYQWVQQDDIWTQMRAIYAMTASGKPISWIQHKHLAVVNILWAVGAKWLSLTGLDQKSTSATRTRFADGHLVYYARARALGLDHRMQLDHPCTHTIQGMAVLSFYLKANGSIQRSWVMAGQALRHAIAFGAHLRPAPGIMTVIEARNRARLWHSLLRLEINLSEITGRPRAVNPLTVSVSLDCSLGSDYDAKQISSQEQPDQDSVDGMTDLEAVKILEDALDLDENIIPDFPGHSPPWTRFGSLHKNMTQAQRIAEIELSYISAKIGDSLYLIQADVPWNEVQKTVHARKLDLSTWREARASSVRLAADGKLRAAPDFSVDLELYFCSVNMILYRPFLCRTAAQTVPTESVMFDYNCGRECMQAAIRLTQIIPDNPDSKEVLQVLPWWTLLHYLCQAGSILLIGASMGLRYMAQIDHDKALAALDKILSYTRVLSPSSKSAFRAWNMLQALMKNVRLRYFRYPWVGVTLAAERPLSWSRENEYALQQTQGLLRIA